MKKLLALVLVFVYIAMLFSGCAPRDISCEISDGVISATISGYGKSSELTDPDAISELIETAESVKFSRASKGKSMDVPGAVTVLLTFTYSDGSEQKVTFPYYFYNGKVYAADEESVKLFGECFEEN